MFISHEKAQEVQKVARVVAVAVISGGSLKKITAGEPLSVRWGILLAGLLGFCIPLMAAVLPEERADILYHSYSGGGVTINGPSLLARKTIGEQVSVWGNFYIDSITSASIDVVTSASQYTEKRTEKGFGVDYLNDTATLSMAYANSVENDFVANSMHFTISQDMFGDLTTVSLGYSRGWDVITATGNDALEESAKRQHYRLGVSQILTKNLLMDLSFETITDEGFLNNPYRNYRYFDTPTTYAFLKEIYPNTRTSHALALRGLYYLPYRAAIKAEYRLYSDTWGINGNMYELGYTHPLDQGLTFDVSYRFYDQNRADFYSDIFLDNTQNYKARDKELSTFSSQTLGVAVSYEFAKKGWKFIDKGSANVSYSHIMFDYKDFRDLRVPVSTPGTEPLYNFSADVVQLYVSVWY
jgi:hypothetical protein